MSRLLTLGVPPSVTRLQFLDCAAFFVPPRAGIPVSLSLFDSYARRQHLFRVALQQIDPALRTYAQRKTRGVMPLRALKFFTTVFSLVFGLWDGCSQKILKTLLFNLVECRFKLIDQALR